MKRRTLLAALLLFAGARLYFAQMRPAPPEPPAQAPQQQRPQPNGKADAPARTTEPRVIPAQSKPTEAEKRRLNEKETTRPAPPQQQGSRSDDYRPVPQPQQPPQPRHAQKRPPKPPRPQVKSTPDGWYDDFNSATAAARNTGRPILVLFTGSDWCPACIKLRKDVFSRHDFQKLADEELVLMFVDSPRGFSLSPNVRHANKMLASTLEAGGAVPQVILLSPDGRKLGEITGYKKEAQYLKELRNLLKKARH